MTDSFVENLALLSNALHKRCC